MINNFYIVIIVLLIIIASFLAFLYLYRIYKIPWIIRSLDKTIMSIAKNRYIDFSKYPSIDDMLSDMLKSYFSKISLKANNR